MTLVVYDYGVRTQTPWYDIFPPRDVNQLNELAASNRLSERDQVKESGMPAQTLPGQGHKGKGQAAPYQEIHDGEPQRKPVYYAKDIMQAPVVTLPESATLQRAWELFKQKGFRHIPVINGSQQLCGLVSERDLLRATSTMVLDHPLSEQRTVVEVMTRRVLTVGPMSEIRELAAAMTGHKVGAMPVLDSEENLVGIVTLVDILQVIMNRAPIDLWS
ncbi:HPP family protein [Maricurvus nonylphenolicus]|uniref:CBS domain-containing protein n=1 Tax=Maricurvus nonylphenolicus TaxID=1008307 RepID=UPI0036F447BB